MRLGRAKALERIDQQSLIERAIDRICPLTQTIIIVTNREQFGVVASARLKGKVVVDLYPGKGPLGGIHSGLARAHTHYGLVVGCDMPFLDRAVLHYLIRLAPDFDVVVPRIGDFTEPLHAVYSKDCLSSIEHLLREGKLAISNLFGLVKTRYVGADEMGRFDPEGLSFFNVNTEGDLTKARPMAKREECS